MPEPVFATRMTLDAAPYLRTSEQVDRTTLQMQQAMQSLGTRLQAMTDAFRPLAQARVPINQLRDSLGQLISSAGEGVAPVGHLAVANQHAGESAGRTSREVRDAAVGFRGMGAAASQAGKLIRDAFVAVPEIAAAVAVFASIGEAIGKIREQFTAGTDLAELARQTGQSVVAVSTLRTTFESFGASADSVGHTLFMLQKSLGGISESGEPTGAAFARIGLSLADLKKLNAPQQFAAIQAGLAKLPTQADRANAAMKIFGRSALDVQAVLNADPADFAKTMQGAQEYAEVMGRNAAMFENVHRRSLALQEQLDTLFAHIAAGLLPVVSKVVELVSRVDFAKWGRDIELAIGIAIQAFKQGKIADIFGLSLVVAFKEAVNVMVSGIYGLAAALQAVFAHVPEMLRDAFAMLTNPAFWKGIGELLLGGIMSIQGRLSAIFAGAAASLANRLADILGHIPFFKDIVAALRGEIAVGQSVVGKAIAGETRAGNAMTASGAADIAGAGSKSLADHLAALRDEMASFQGAFTAAMQADPAHAGNEISKLNSIMGELAKSVRKQVDDLNKPLPAAAPGQSSVAYKTPDADRLAKVGLFVGSSPASPGLSEARRTASATERMSRSMTDLINITKGLSKNGGVVYAE